MHIIKAFFARNKIDIVLGLGLAVITGLIFYYPNYRIKANISKDDVLAKHFVYSPLVATRIGETTDELKYGTLSKKVMVGNFSLGDPLIFERRNNLNPMSNLPFLIGGLLSRVFGSVNSFFMFADFFFPFLSIIFGYIFLRVFLGNRLIAFWGIVVLLSMYNLPKLVNVFLFRFEEAFAQSSNFKDSFNFYALKYPSYQLVFPLTFLSYFSCYQLLKGNTNRYCILTGVLVGVFSYIYVYSFFTLGLQLVFLMVWAYLKGNKHLALRLFLTGMLALAIGSFYLKGLLIFAMDPAHIYKSITIGLSKSVDYNIVYALLKFLFFTILLLLLAWKIGSITDEVLFLLSIMLPTASLMVISTQVFFLPQTQHLATFETRTFTVISVLLLVSICLNKDLLSKIIPLRFCPFTDQRHRYTKIILIILIVLNCGQIMASEVYYLDKKSSLYYPKFTVDRNIVDAYGWLEKHVTKDSVILSLDEQQISLMPTFVGGYIYIPDMFLSMSSPAEVWGRIKQGFGFYGVGEGVLRDILRGYQPRHSEGILDSRPLNTFDLRNRDHAYLEFRKKWFPFTIFHGHFLFDSKSLSLEQYKRYLNSDEIGLVYQNESGKSHFQGVFFIPSKLIDEQLADYKSDSGNIGLLKYKVDYVWFGPLEKDLSGLDGLSSDNLRLVFQNEKIRIYEVDRQNEPNT